MDVFELGPVPAPRETAVATLAELKSHPELYYDVSYPYVLMKPGPAAVERQEVKVGILTLHREQTSS